MIRLLSLLMGATLFALVSCGGGENGDGNGEDEPATPITPSADGDPESYETVEGGDEQAKASGAAGEKLVKICCGGAAACPAPAGYCCNEDGTCRGSHEKLPTYTP